MLISDRCNYYAIQCSARCSEPRRGRMLPFSFVVSKLKMTNRKRRKRNPLRTPFFFSFVPFARFQCSSLYNRNFFPSNSLLTVVSSLIQLVRVSLLSFTLDTLYLQPYAFLPYRIFFSKHLSLCSFLLDRVISPTPPSDRISSFFNS